MDFIKSLINLQALNVQRGSFEFPKITGEVLELKNLKILDLTGNIDPE